MVGAAAPREPGAKEEKAPAEEARALEGDAGGLLVPGDSPLRYTRGTGELRPGKVRAREVVYGGGDVTLVNVGATHPGAVDSPSRERGFARVGDTLEGLHVVRLSRGPPYTTLGTQDFRLL